jgi:hypothetical protein
MDLLMFHLENVNWFAVLVAVLPSYLLGSAWYAPPVFGKYWMKASGLKEKDFKDANFFRTLAIASVMNVVMVTGLAVLLSALVFDTATQGAAVGALVGLGFATASRGVHTAFEYRSMGLVVLNGAYDTIFLTLAGAILGAF